MATKRKRVNRLPGQRVTATVVDTYREAMPLQGKYHDCMFADKCPEGLTDRHCADCLRYLELSRNLDRELGIKPWEIGPLGADDSHELRQQIEAQL